MKNIKNKKGESVNPMYLLIIAIIIILIGIALITSAANTKATQTKMLTMTNDSITYAGVEAEGQINASYQMNITKAQTGWRTTGCPISSYSLTNSTGEDYTETTDYVFTDAYGNFTLVNTAKVNASLQSDNLTYVSYTYCDEGYLTSSGDRGLADLWILMMIIVLLVVVVGIAMKIMNDK